jgi:hypothetical protein
VRDARRHHPELMPMPGTVRLIAGSGLTQNQSHYVFASEANFPANRARNDSITTALIDSWPFLVPGAQI